MRDPNQMPRLAPYDMKEQSLFSKGNSQCAILLVLGMQLMITVILVCLFN